MGPEMVTFLPVNTLHIRGRVWDEGSRGPQRVAGDGHLHLTVPSAVPTQR